ncbi:MAG: cobyric acid synthase [Gemmataceae bacterium]|nr:cobyric acid synthase [Gemmataceae bacterium]
MTRALMIQGTASHVGKSVLTAAFGRWLRDRGLRVAPFKAQNMSLNSAVTVRGEEIARSQAAQADALGVEPSADMNPVLLKPLDRGCQVVVQGRGIGVMAVRDYYAYRPHAWRAITESYNRLAATQDAVVLEGAGSPVEINLKEHDLVNMRMARHAGAAVVLVADIERGGVFAQLIGTWELLDAEDRDRVVGFVINKFRGDASLLDPGLEFVRARTGRPVLGVLPYDPTICLDEEDSLGLAGSAATAAVDVAVLRLPGISNFTDFAALARAPGVGVRYVSAAGQLHSADLVILPGTRTVVRALEWLRAGGLADELQGLASRTDGPVILGVCGGLQLLGHTVADPDAVESACSHAEGLGLLDVDTVFASRKTLARVEGEVVAATSLCAECPVVGYEIHQGASTRRAGVRPWLRVRRQPSDETVEDGAVSADGRTCGTYLHGLFDDARFCRALVDALRRRRRLTALSEADWLAQRDFLARRSERLGRWLEDFCDLRPVEEALNL